VPRAVEVAPADPPVDALAVVDLARGGIDIEAEEGAVDGVEDVGHARAVDVDLADDAGGAGVNVGPVDGLGLGGTGGEAGQAGDGPRGNESRLHGALLVTDAQGTIRPIAGAG